MFYYDGQKGPTPGIPNPSGTTRPNPWFTDCQHHLSRRMDRPAYPYTHIRVVPGCDQSRHVRALSYKIPTWVSGLRHHRLLLSWQRAGAKLVLDQQFSRAQVHACTRSKAHIACEETDVACGRLKTRALPVKAAARWRAVLARGEELRSRSVRGCRWESGAANQQTPGTLVSLQTGKLGGGG
jgi:hypothetical protein